MASRLSVRLFFNLAIVTEQEAHIKVKVYSFVPFTLNNLSNKAFVGTEIRSNLKVNKLEINAVYIVFFLLARHMDYF